MLDPNRLHEVQPDVFLFTDPRWQRFFVLQRGVRGQNMILGFTPVDDRFNPFFVHVADEPDSFMFLEQAQSEDDISRVYRARTEPDAQGFTLSVETGLRVSVEDITMLELQLSERERQIQEGLGVNTPNGEDVDRFEKLVDSFAEDLLHRYAA